MNKSAGVIFLISDTIYHFKDFALQTFKRMEARDWEQNFSNTVYQD